MVCGFALVGRWGSHKPCWSCDDSLALEHARRRSKTSLMYACDCEWLEDVLFKYFLLNDMFSIFSKFLKSCFSTLCFHSDALLISISIILCCSVRKGFFCIPLALIWCVSLYLRNSLPARTKPLNRQCLSALHLTLLFLSGFWCTRITTATIFGNS